jgi:hypothetical protein|nr:MAG TPA: hypothetical protein [Caudoviricetes sp.]
MGTSLNILDASLQSFIEYQDYNPENGLLALKNIEIVIPICSNLWHLTDNIWNDYNDSLKITYSDIGQFRIDIIKSCKELALLHDIITQRKHASISRPKSDFSRLQIYEGSPINFEDSPAVFIITKDGQKRNVVEVIDKVLQFWYSFIYDLILVKKT